ncbi:MAG TPA: hypothetical protein VFK33_05200 [Bacillales bacterium]|nr:hypothetical protein [Bacillales bacterium]
MRRIFLLAVITFFGFGLMGDLQAHARGFVKAAFVRDGNLWIKTPNDERQITKGGGVSSPEWSYDGKWIAYSKTIKEQDPWKQQLWVYNVQKDQKHRVFLDNVYDYHWAPDKDVLAFLDGNVLDVVKLQHDGDHHFKNAALGINNFAWLPDGSGFLASSSGHLLPTGWTAPILFKIPADATLSSDNIERFFEIPKDQFDISTTGTSTFKWSPDKKWIAFLVVPTASISADTNTLCLLSSDGKTFKTVDEMLNDET